MRWILIFLVLVSCSTRVDQLFAFELEGRFTIDPGLNTFDTYYFPISQVPNTIEVRRGSTELSDIQRILPQKARLVAPFVDFDWSIVQQVVVYAISPLDSEQRKEIFYQDRISINRQNELRLFSSSLDVKEILSGDFVNIQVAIRFREVTPIQWDARIEMSFIADGGTK